jgi:hypothetical protein
LILLLFCVTREYSENRMGLTGTPDAAICWAADEPVLPVTTVKSIGASPESMGWRDQ